MSSNLVIAAIPDENDRVWKVSSEKIPHLTLLFLGDVEAVKNLDQIILFVEHAANMTLRRFYLPVDRRGELGADQADVLFFRIGRYEYKTIRDFRAALLQDNNIKTAYDSSTQFDGVWQPHLTLGYPAAPANDVPDDYTFYDVAFNKIAVWTNDFDGPEFLLKDYGEEVNLADFPMDIAMSDTRVANLQHYGVKGMRWGVRSEKGGSNTSGVGEVKREGAQRFLDPQGHGLSTDVAKTVVGTLIPVVSPLTIPAQVRLTRGAFRGAKAHSLHKQEQKFAKNAQSVKNFVAIHNGSSEKFNREIEGINKKYPDDLTKSPAKQKRYDNEVLKLMQDSYRESANSLINKANTMHLDVEFRNDGMDFAIKAHEGPGTPLPQRVKHAATDSTGDIMEFTGKIKRDAMGHIVGFDFDNFDQKSMAQTVALGADFLIHYGVKGMHWGVRREQAITTQTHIDTGLLRRKTQIQAKGGQSHPAHEDAVKVEVARQKLKKSGAAALSNRELRDMRDRIQLETQVKSLMTKKGQKQVQKQLEESGKQQLQKGIGIGLAKGAPHVLKKAKRAGAAAGAAAALV